MRYTINFKVFGVLDNELLDGNDPAEPVEIEVGEDTGEDSPIEAALRGMKAGETTDFEVDPEDSFGEWFEDRVEKIPLSRFADADGLEVGELYAFGDPGEEEVFFRVVSREGDELVCDFNHPLAGRRLRFEVSLISVEP